jgi:L-fuculose-phosphate aldolase
MVDVDSLRAQMIRVCRQLAARGLVAATDGNVSCRAGEDLLLITPGGKSKGDLEPRDLLVVDFEGGVREGEGKPSSEIRMHALVYRRRPDANAVVHAHPPMLTALTLADVPFLADALPEVWLTIGPVPTAPYATPCTAEVPESISPFIGDHQAILLERHGSVTLGKDLNEAYMRLEKLEHAAHCLFYACLLRGRQPEPLPSAALMKIENLLRCKV